MDICINKTINTHSSHKTFRVQSNEDGKSCHLQSTKVQTFESNQGDNNKLELKVLNIIEATKLRLCNRLIHNLCSSAKAQAKETVSLNDSLRVIDDRLAFYSYVATVPAFERRPDIKGAKSQKGKLDKYSAFYDRPLLLSNYQKAPFTSYSVIVFKDPKCTDSTETRASSVLTEALDFASALRENKLRAKDDSSIVDSGNPIYCYVVADLTSALSKECERHNLCKNKSGSCYYGFVFHEGIFITVVSYELLLQRAEMLNVDFI